jgi:MFS family permease
LTPQQAWIFKPGDICVERAPIVFAERLDWRLTSPLSNSRQPIVFPNKGSDLTEAHMPVHRSFAALRDRGFRSYFLYSALAMMADSVEHVISYWVVFQKFHSPALGGYAVLSHWLPMLFFGVLMGALADRYDSRRLIQIGMLLFMACSLTWGILFLTDTLEAWHTAVILTVHGVASVFWGPPGQVLLHDIVGTQQLPSAVRLNATSRYLGLLAGPAVGAAFLLALGPAYGILLNTVIYLPLVLFLWKAPYGPRFQKDRPPVRPVRGFSDIATTIASIRNSRIIVSMILLSGCASLIISNAYQAQMPSFAQDLGHGSAGVLYGLLLTADAAGALAGGIVLEGSGWLQPQPRTAFMLVMIWCCVLAAFAMTTVYPLALAMLFVAGFVDLSYNSMTQALVQLNAPAAIRGRVLGLYSMAGMGLRAFSGITVGVGGSLIGIHWSLALSALLLLAITLALQLWMRSAVFENR